MNEEIIKVALIQQSAHQNYQQNLDESMRGIIEATNRGAQLVLLQELHTGPYFCQVEDAALFANAEPIPGPSTEKLAKLAQALKVVIVGSIFEKRAPGLCHNTAVVIDTDGSIAGIYRKMHIPDDPGFHEKFYFSPGDLGFTPIATSVGKLGVLVCWDQWYPEAARLMALNGAEILLYPTAIGWGTMDADPKERERQRNAWITIQRSHAIANGLPVIVANRVGFEENLNNPKIGIEFWGSSFITNPQGDILVQANEKKKEVLVTEIDKNQIEKVRCNWPFLRDRRIDAYDGLLQRYLDEK